MIHVPPPAIDGRQADSPSAARRRARWSDGDIVAALRAADTGRDHDAKTARNRSKSVRVDRFAEDVLQQERELTRDEANLAVSLGATTSPLAEQVEQARHAANVAAVGRHEGEFDRDFIAGEIRYERELIRLIDSEMIPDARSPDLRVFLRSLRAILERRVVAAQEVSSNLR
jgi:predicted outer membrane protein